MPKSCCISNCHNSDGGQRNFFVLPKDEERRRQWLNAISPYLREGRKKRKFLYVCDSHFKDDDILRNTSIHLKNGTIDTIACLRVTLKQSSIPSIFYTKHGVLANIELPAAENNKSNTLTSKGKGQMEVALEKNSRTEETNPEEEKETGLLPDGERAYNLKMLGNELNILWKKANNHIWGSNFTPTGLIISYFGENPNVATKTIFVKEDMSTEIRAAGQIFMNDFQKKIKSVNDVLSLMSEVKKNYLCQGIDNSTSCPYGYFKSSTTPNSGRCSSCRIKRKQKLNNLARVSKRSILQANKTKQLIKNLKQRNKRLVKNLALAKGNIEELKARCALASEAAIEKAMKHFSSAQQEAVKACLTATQCKGPTGIRYSQSWISECILLRMKSPRAYRHVLSHQILQVPTIDTLDKYLKKMKPSYGFNAETFDFLREKAAEMKPDERQEKKDNQPKEYDARDAHDVKNTNDYVQPF